MPASTHTANGNEFAIHTDITEPHYAPAITSLSNDNYVVVWNSGGNVILGRLFSVDGTSLSDQFPVNSDTGGLYGNASVAALSNGGFVATWHSENQDGDGWGIFGQVFSADGDKIGDEFQANTLVTGHQFAPQIGALEDGRFVIVWIDEDGRDGDANGSYGQLFANDGSTIGDEFQINTFTEGDQQGPDIVGLQNGGFVIVWNGDDASTIENNGGNNVFARLYDADAQPVTDEFRVNAYTDAVQGGAIATVLNDGSFIVVWDVWPDHSGNGAGVYGQRYAEDGTPIKDEFQISDLDIVDATIISADGLADGGFVVTWYTRAGIEDGDFNIHARTYTADGDPLSDEFIVNTFTDGVQQSPAVSSLSDGGFLIAWTSVEQNDGDFGVYAQAYTSNPSARGGDGDDHLFGDDNRNLLIGMDGNDTVEAGAGNDAVWAGPGDSGDDSLRGGAGEDKLGGGAGNDLLFGDDGHDSIYGSAGDDELYGGAGNDLIFNGSGNDTVAGGVGDDTLWGSGGDDILFGEDGTDTFVFGALVGTDVVMDFSVDKDVLDLTYVSADFADLAAVTAVATEGLAGFDEGISIDLGNEQSVFLVGITLDDLSIMTIIL